MSINQGISTDRQVNNSHPLVLIQTELLLSGMYNIECVAYDII